MTTRGFWTQVRLVCPEADLDQSSSFADLPTYSRLVLHRWLASALEQPTDLDVIRQMRTLGDADRWLDRAIRSGEVVRSGSPTRSRVQLRPVEDRDLVDLYRASQAPASSGTWRYRGRTLPIDEFVATFHDGVRTQFVVDLIETGVPIGLVVAYDHNQSAQHCKVGFLRSAGPQPGARGATLEGMLLFLSHLFGSYPYRKVYAEVPEPNAWIHVPPFTVEEAVLREYAFSSGELVDVRVLSLSRRRWEEVHRMTGW